MNSILTPILVLVAWSLVVWLWMYATRLPAMQKARIEPQSARFPGSLAVLPDGVRQVADNYNHLMEQPTIFYALAVYVHLVGHADALNIGLAWSYVGLRIAHSLVQGTVNLVMARFALFALSTIALIAITAREILALI